MLYYVAWGTYGALVLMLLICYIGVIRGRLTPQMGSYISCLIVLFCILLYLIAPNGL